jgi:hypothetical protein
MSGRFRPDDMTSVQEAFMVGLTDQRVANLWAAADDWAELSPDAKNLLRNADKTTLKWLERASPDDITQLQYSIKFMEASKLLGKVAWVTAAAICGGLITVLTLWDKIKSLVGTKT